MLQITRPLMITQVHTRPQKVTQGHSRPFKAIQSHLRQHKAIHDAIPECATKIIFWVFMSLILTYSNFFCSLFPLFTFIASSAHFLFRYSSDPNKRAYTPYLILTKLPPCTILFEPARLFIFLDF